jgi:hypothetical protein
MIDSPISFVVQLEIHLHRITHILEANLVSMACLVLHKCVIFFDHGLMSSFLSLEEI